VLKCHPDANAYRSSFAKSVNLSLKVKRIKQAASSKVNCEESNILETFLY